MHKYVHLLEIVPSLGSTESQFRTVFSERWFTHRLWSAWAIWASGKIMWMLDKEEVEIVFAYYYFTCKISEYIRSYSIRKLYMKKSLNLNPKGLNKMVNTDLALMFIIAISKDLILVFQAFYGWTLVLPLTDIFPRISIEKQPVWLKLMRWAYFCLLNNSTILYTSDG